MSDAEEPPAELVQAIGAALLLALQPGGGLFGRLSYAAPRYSDHPAPLSFSEEEEL